MTPTVFFKMCYHIAFCDEVCINDHPVIGHGKIFRRQCRAHAEACHEGHEEWDTMCDYDTPPYTIWLPTDPVNISVKDSECKVCQEISEDTKLQEELNPQQEKKDEEIAQKKKRIARVNKVLTDVLLEARAKDDHKYAQWDGNTKRLQNQIKLLEPELTRLLLEAEYIQDQYFRRKREFEEPNEDDMIDVAQERADREGVFYWYGDTNRKERDDHPYHYPKRFPDFAAASAIYHTNNFDIRAGDQHYPLHRFSRRGYPNVKMASRGPKVEGLAPRLLLPGMPEYKRPPDDPAGPGPSTKRGGGPGYRREPPAPDAGAGASV